jgi:ankyrin repeat protein
MTLGAIYLYGRLLIEGEDDGAVALREVTIGGDSARLRSLARFLEGAAAELEEGGAHGCAGWHQHYQDFAREDSREEFWGGDVIVMQPLPPREDLGDPFLAQLRPLVRAARLGQSAVVGRMLADGQDPEQRGLDGTGALHAACDANAPLIVEMLLKAGTDVDQPCGLGRTPLMRAAVRANTQLAAMLLDAGADAARTDDDGGTALIEAAASGNYELTQMLIDAGADIRAVWDDSCTALTNAAGSGHAEIVGLLLALGVGPDETPCALTALMEAAESGHVAAVKILLDAGADPLLTYQGQTALDMAVERGHSEVAEILRAAVGANRP